MSRLRRSRRGAAALEFALFLPILFAALGVTVDLGWFFWRHSLVLDAAREGARVGADTVDSSSSSGPASEADIEDAAITHAKAVLAARGVTCSTGCRVEAAWATDGSSGYELLTVTVTYPYEALLGIWLMDAENVGAQFTVFTAVQV